MRQLTVDGVEDGHDARREAGDVERRGSLEAALGEADGRDEAHREDHALREHLEERSERRGHHRFKSSLTGVAPVEWDSTSLAF